MASIVAAFERKSLRPVNWRDNLAYRKAYRRRVERMEKRWKHHLKVDNRSLIFYFKCLEEIKGTDLQQDYEELIVSCLETRDDVIDSLFQSMLCVLKADMMMKIAKDWR